MALELWVYAAILVGFSLGAFMAGFYMGRFKSVIDVLHGLENISMGEVKKLVEKAKDHIEIEDENEDKKSE